MKRIRQRLVGQTAALLALFFLSACSPVTSAKTQSATQSRPSETIAAPSSVASEAEISATKSAEPAVESAQKSQLADLLAKLSIDTEYPEGYDRDLFDHWIDADSDGCNTRREVLIAESLSRLEIASGCDIVGGSWLSVYDSTTTDDYSELDIDHMVPLKEAWDSGAYAWDYDTRKRFANDLGFDGSLIAVTASSNRSKSDRDPAQWLPSNSNHLCQYTANWLQVKYRWNLSIDSSESLALGSLVVACDDFPVTVPEKATIKVAQAQKPSPTGNDPMFGSCKEAKANGFGPYLKGVDEEYDWYRDGDKDGTVCE
jgi:hypothetical protein